MLLVEVPWASRVWTLPFLSALAPSERCAAKRGKRHKKITEWAWQLLAAKALVSTAQYRGHSRPRLRLSEAAFSLPRFEQAGNLHHPSQARCRPLRACSSTPSRTDRQASPQG